MPLRGIAHILISLFTDTSTDGCRMTLTDSRYGSRWSRTLILVLPAVKQVYISTLVLLDPEEAEVCFVP